MSSFKESDFEFNKFNNKKTFQKHVDMYIIKIIGFPALITLLTPKIFNRDWHILQWVATSNCKQTQSIEVSF